MSQAKSVSLQGKFALVTGAARRIGAAIAELLHDNGVNVAIHYRGSKEHAAKLAARLNQGRPDSAKIFRADLAARNEPEALIDAVTDWSGRLDISLMSNGRSLLAVI
jgi:pteridine reductase